MNEFVTYKNHEVIVKILQQNILRSPEDYDLFQALHHFILQLIILEMNLYMELTIFVYNLNLWNNHEILLFGGLLMVRVPLVILQIEIMIKQDALSKNHGNFDQLRVNLNFKLHSYNQLARYFVIIVFMVGNNTLTIDILKRGSRRSIGLHIIEDGKLEVRAPYLMPKFFIDRFVASKRDWIIKTKQTMRNRKHVAKVAYHEGSVFRLAGVPYTLHITEGNTIVILGSRIFFPKSFYIMQSAIWSSGSDRLPKISNYTITLLCKDNECVL